MTRAWLLIALGCALPAAAAAQAKWRKIIADAKIKAE
jgi:hypothetical protein